MYISLIEEANNNGALFPGTIFNFNLPPKVSKLIKFITIIQQ